MNGFLEKLALSSHENQEKFRSSSWLSPKAYLVYKVILVLFLTPWMPYSMYLDGSVLWLIYLTHWTFTAEWVYFCTSAYQAFRGYSTKSSCAESRSSGIPDVETQSASLEKDGNIDLNLPLTSDTPKIGVLEYVQWIAYYITLDCCVIVTIVYWLFVYEGKFGANTFVLHTINSLVMVFDQLIVAMPCGKMHFWVAQVYGVIYLVQTLIYWGADKTSFPIYDIIDWSNSPGGAALWAIILICIGIPLMHMLFYGLSQLREKYIVKSESIRT